MTAMLKLFVFSRWRSLFRLRLLLAAALAFGMLAVGGLLALRSLKPDPPAQILPGQTLAWDIARAATGSPEVQLTSGAYVPGDALLLYTRTAQTDRARVRTWAMMQLEPFADRLAQLPADETLTWVIDFGPAPGEQEVLQAPLNHADDPTLYRYTAAAPGLLATSAPMGMAMLDATSAPTAALAPTAATVPTSASTASTASTALPTDKPATDQAVSLLNTSFDEQGDGGQSIWLPLSGDWVMEDGIYTQRESEGYDYISMLDLPPQSHYSLEVRLRLAGGEMGGGLVYNVPGLTSRAGAQSVDFDQQGGFLRWGRYDDKGNYVYEGGTQIEPPINDEDWHTLRVVNQTTDSVVFLDERELGTITNTSQRGYLGLTVSQAQVDFDDVQVVTLSGNIGTPASVSPTEAVASEDFSDDFDDGNARGWQVLNGTWQSIDGAYQQTSVSGSDLISVSIFRSDSFTATVRIKRIDADMGAGLCFGMAQRSSKARSQIVIYTQGGEALQWGHFDEGGNFVFEGSAPVPDGGDGEWHTLAVSVQDGQASFTLDDEQVAGDVELTYTGGYVGLITSNSKVAFDDVQFVAQ